MPRSRKAKARRRRGKQWARGNGKKRHKPKRAEYTYVVPALSF
jgi:hypothetical protein